MTSTTNVGFMAEDAKASRRQAFTFDQAADAVRNGRLIDETVQHLLSELTKDERLSLLDGDEYFYKGLRTFLRDRYNRVPLVLGAVERLQIPGVRFTDGPRGHRIRTKNRQRNRLEAKAQGANYFAGVCINLPRHPAWGRIQETYGQNPLILGQFGSALTQGVQNYMMACVKHFALNSMENARFQVDVKVEENVLREVYLPHFRRVIEGGAASVMSSYNSVNGEWAGQNKMLLNDILRGEWGFNGFTLSDFIFGFRNSALSLRNGLDIEAPFKQQRYRALEAGLASDQLHYEDVDRSCLRILRKQLEFAIDTRKGQPDEDVVFCREHRLLAREVARRSIVLLKNESVGDTPLLPLNLDQVRKVAIVGRLASVANTGVRGSSQVFTPHVVSTVEGLKAAMPDCDIFIEDTDDPRKASALAARVDVVLCVVGFDATDEGEYLVPPLQNNSRLLDLFPPADTAEDKETLSLFKDEIDDNHQGSGLEVGAGEDRKSLDLRPQDIELINAVTATNQRTIISIVTGGAIFMEGWKDKAPAILISWYAGCEGGHALADVLLGHHDASGRLPFPIPKDESQLPFFDIGATEMVYDRWYGQNLIDRLGAQPSFPLGYGLSYTTFTIQNVQVVPPTADDAEQFRVCFMVVNTGIRDGRFIGQVYGLPALADFPSRSLLGFLPVDLRAGQSQMVTMTASTRPLQRWISGVFILPNKEVAIEVASYAGDQQAIRTSLFL